jgi:hypothetical protein
LQELNFSTLFYEQLGQFYEGFSYQQKIQWESLQKFEDFLTNIFNLFFKAIKVSIQKVISSGWV